MPPSQSSRESANPNTAARSVPSQPSSSSSAHTSASANRSETQSRAGPGTLFRTLHPGPSAQPSTSQAHAHVSPASQSASLQLETSPGGLAVLAPSASSSQATAAANPARASQPIRVPVPTPQQASATPPSVPRPSTQSTSPIKPPTAPTTPADALAVASPSTSSDRRPSQPIVETPVRANGTSIPNADATPSETARTANTSTLHPAPDPASLQHLRGSFLTSSTPLDYDSLLKESDKVTPIPVVSCTSFSDEELRELIIEQLEIQCLPLVISDLHRLPGWPSDLFSPAAYQQAMTKHKLGDRFIHVRNLTDSSDRQLTVAEFMQHCDDNRQYKPNEQHKLYGKDLRCPSEWKEAIDQLVHSRLQYHGEQDATAAVTPNARPDTQMCYFGPGQTCTPWHRDLCSSLGQNLMVWSDEGASAIWLIAHPDRAEDVDRYIASRGADPQSEGFAPHPRELAADADFRIFCCEQKLGDLVLIPSRSTHMVANVGGRAMKVAWSRMTVESLRSAMLYDLPGYQRFCRKESYHIKRLIEAMLIKLTKQVESDLLRSDLAVTPLQTVRELRKLLELYDAILSDEYVPEWRDIEVWGGHEDYVECDFCGASVLGGYFECALEETLCAMCYCQGRLCGCANAAEEMKPRQHWRTFGERFEIRNAAARALITIMPRRPSSSSSSESPTIKEQVEEAEEAEWQPVNVLQEKDVGKQAWPHSFMAAHKLYTIRQTPGWRQNVAPCRMCKAVLDITQRYYCKPCRYSYCFGCLLHKVYIHPVHALAQKNSEMFHKYHAKSSKLDYKEWRLDPLSYRDEARSHFALIEAAKTKSKCVPLNPSCRIGFLDSTEEYPRGLSGTLGVRRGRKPAFETSTPKMYELASSASASSLKRQNDAIQLPSTASPGSPSRKRAKPNPPPESQPIAQPSAQTHRAAQATDSPMTESSPTGPSLAEVQDLPASVVVQDKPAVLGEKDLPPTSALTISNGVRKFVLRVGGAVSVRPSNSEPPSTPVAPPSSGTPSISRPPSQASTSAATNGLVKPVKSALVAIAAAPAATVAVSASTSAPASGGSSISRPPSQVSTSIPSKATAHPTKAAVVAPVVAPTASVAIPTVISPSISGPASISRPPTQSSASTSTNGTAQPTKTAAVAPAVASTAPVVSTPAAVSTSSLAVPLDASTSATAAVLAATSQQANVMTPAVAVDLAASSAPAAAASSSSVAATGLASLNPGDLRVITEILRIFSQTNQRAMQDAIARVEAKLDAQAAQVDENRKAMARLEALLVAQEERQEERYRVALAETEARVLVTVTAQQEAAGKALREQLAAQSQDLRQDLRQSRERIDSLHDALNVLMADIDRGARAQLEQEIAAESSAATAGVHASHPTFTLTSMARTQGD
ncbi:related to c-module-binding factor [Moesziomyces antarcticus]|nr:related to c-module-binding factor [Moesziomyces antarcticus]